MKLTKVLVKLGIESAIVVHGMDGFDEISLIGKTHVARFQDGNINEEVLAPQSFGFEQRRFEEISALEEIDEHVLVALRILSRLERSEECCERHRSREFIRGLGRFWDEPQITLEGVEIARSSLKSGKALDKLTQLVKYSGGDIAVIEEFLRKI